MTGLSHLSCNALLKRVPGIATSGGANMLSMPEEPDATSRDSKKTVEKNRRFLSWALLIATGFVLFLFGGMVSARTMAWFQQAFGEGHQTTLYWSIAITLLIYAILMSIPFVPGIEIGLGLLIVLGPRIALPVYLATIVAFSCAFIIGQIFPPEKIAHLCHRLRLVRAEILIRNLAWRTQDERIKFLVMQAPNRFSSLLIRHPYLALAAAVNMPCNALIGGGGGIALLAGMSRLYTIPRFLLTIALAVAPIPLAYYFWATV